MNMAQIPLTNNKIKSETEKHQIATDVKVYKTTNYGQFKKVPGNRPLYRPHVDNLVAAIDENNMLAENPIVVDADLRVEDGQHRLAAASELGVAIYYIIKPKTTLSEIQMLNRNIRAWTTADFMESYIALGKKDYLELKNFSETYRISIAIAIRVLADKYDQSFKVLEDFRNGEFKVVDREKAERIASLIMDVRQHSPDMAFAHRECIKALSILDDKVGHKELGKQLSKYQMVVTRRPSVQDYLRQFENIINSNRTDGKQYLLS